MTDAYLDTLGALAAIATLATPVLTLRWLRRTPPAWWLRARLAVRRARHNP